MSDDDPNICFLCGDPVSDDDDFISDEEGRVHCRCWPEYPKPHIRMLVPKDEERDQ